MIERDILRKVQDAQHQGVKQRVLSSALGLGFRGLRTLGLTDVPITRDVAVEKAEEPRYRVGYMPSPEALQAIIDRDERDALSEDQIKADFEREYPDYKEAPFSLDLQRTLLSAKQAARSLNHNNIGTEHLLLGLVSDNGSISSCALVSQGAMKERIREGVVAIIGQGERFIPYDITLTQRAKRTISLGFEYAQREGSDTLTSEHVLLGILNQNEGIGAGVLGMLRVNIGKAMLDVQKMRNNPFEPQTT